MPIVRTFECPSCEGQFDHMFMRSDEPAPDTCPLCQAYVGDDPLLQIPAAPRLSTGNAGKSGDAVYRAMEQTSQNRVEMAAAMTPGAQQSDMAVLKTTDHTPAPKGQPYRMPMSATAGAMEAQARQMSFSTGGNAWADGVRSGPHPNAGNSVREGIVNQHSGVAAQVRRQGQMNRK